MKNCSCTCFKKKSSNEQYLVIICNSNKKNETDNPRWTVVSNQKIKVVVCLLFGMTKQLSQGSKPMIDARRLEGATLQLWTDMQGVSWQCPGHLICSCVDDPSFVSIFAKAFLVWCGWTKKKKKNENRTTTVMISNIYWWTLYYILGHHIPGRGLWRGADRCAQCEKKIWNCLLRRNLSISFAWLFFSFC